MFGEQRTRTLLGPADPARNAAVALPRLSARDLIARAETTAKPVVGRRHVRPTRRLVLSAGAVAVVAGAAGVVHRFDGRETVDPPGAESGVVLVPIAYQIDSGASAAGAQLRALADRLVDAAYDNHTGRYMYHHTKVWGDPVVISPGGRYRVAHVSETKLWQAADGTGKQVTIQLEPQYPDQESRDYWQRVLQETKDTPAPHATPAPDTMELPPANLVPLPSDRAGLTERLKVGLGAGAVSKQVGTVYGRYVVPCQTRAEILRILADVPGFLWRGEVTDRAGRKGVAITFDDRGHDVQHPLVFDPNTGDLLASELLGLSPVRISAYQLILGTDWANQLG